MQTQQWDKYNFKKRVSFFLLGFFLLQNSFGQLGSVADFCATKAYQPPPVNKKKLRNIIIGESTTYVAGMTGAYFMWYQYTPTSKFHFFDDSKEWLQMDKFGHFSSAFVLADLSYKIYGTANFQGKKALRISCLQSLFFMTSLEVYDGFSRDWGFSWSDMGFNSLGILTYYINKSTNERISIQPKFSFGKSKFAPYRPEVLGHNYVEQIFKDYNGQTYWFSINLGSLLLKQEGFLKVLNFSLGYGANGMTGGHDNPNVNEAGVFLPEFQRYRQLYFSLDLDLRKIPASNKFLRKALNVLNIIKFPFPALEISRGKLFMNYTSYGM